MIILVCSSTVEGDDFNVLTPLELMFLPTSDQTTVLCINISIISDGVVEGAESFQLNLVGIDLSDIERVMLGSPELVIVQPSSAVVNIIDGDGMFKRDCKELLLFTSLHASICLDPLQRLLLVYSRQSTLPVRERCCRCVL